jgi:hypothetical protein
VIYIKLCDFASWSAPPPMTVGPATNVRPIAITVMGALDVGKGQGTPDIYPFIYKQEASEVLHNP